jgi:polyketide cyclase/dehydrase/lipid transport protein
MCRDDADGQRAHGRSIETMTENALVLEQSVAVDVSPEFAWSFRTDIATWSDPPATFHLDGPFADGAQGRTMVPGQPSWVWSIREVRPGRSFAIEMALDRATIRFEWLFDAARGGTTHLTQRIMLSGINARAYKAQVEAGFGATLSDGMKRIAEQMVAADRAIKRAR